MKVNVNINSEAQEIELKEYELVKRPVAELLDIHNSLYPDSPLTAWKSAKTKLVARIMSDFAIEPTPAPVKPKKEKAKKERRPSKSQQMLTLLEEANGPIHVQDLVAKLFTSEASVRCYVSYFKTGKKNHPIVPMHINKGLVTLGDKPATEETETE